MTTGPTQGAAEVDDGQWRASPFAAVSIRVLAALIPFVVAWFVVTALSDSFLQPAGLLGVALWLMQSVITGLAVAMTTERFTRRALPLASLFNMTLVFPDQAPSRFSVALRSGTVRKLESRSGSLDAPRLSGTPTEAAAQAVELVAALSRHDRLTRGHTERVRAYADLIGEEMGLSAADRSRLAWGALLHDVGKMTVPPEILNKQGRPSEAEWEILAGHPAASARMLAPLQDWLGEWILAAPQHHERWDGTGYPLRLAGTEISLAGRIVAVADAYDVITSSRSYKKPSSAEAAREELIRCAGTQFDPDVVRAFLNVSLRRRVLSGPLASILELPRIVNIGANLPAASAVVAGTVATVGSIMVTPPPQELPQDLAFGEPVVLVASEAAEPVSSDEPTAIGTTIAAEPAQTDGDPAVESAVEPLIEPPPTTPPEDGSETTEPVVAVGPADDQAPTTTATLAASPPTTAGPGPTTTQSITATTRAATTTTTLSTTGTQATTTTTQATTTTTQPTTTTTQATTTTTQPTTTTTTIPPGSPDASPDSVSVDDDKDVSIDVLNNDDSGNSAFDESTLEIITDPLHGNDFRVHNDHLHYRSDKNYDGIDTIEYRICNTNGLCDTQVVTITVSS